MSFMSLWRSPHWNELQAPLAWEAFARTADVIKQLGGTPVQVNSLLWNSLKEWLEWVWSQPWVFKTWFKFSFILKNSRGLKMLVNHPSRKAREGLLWARIFPYSSGKEGSWEGSWGRDKKWRTTVSSSLSWEIQRALSMELRCRPGKRWICSISHTAGEGEALSLWTWWVLWLPAACCWEGNQHCIWAEPGMGKHRWDFINTNGLAKEEFCMLTR